MSSEIHSVLELSDRTVVVNMIHNNTGNYYTIVKSEFKH